MRGFRFRVFGASGKQNMVRNMSRDLRLQDHYTGAGTTTATGCGVSGPRLAKDFKLGRGTYTCSVLGVLLPD